ncbi:MAG: hypothetical protein JNK73_00995 [Bacteroidia bacterium]|nr:hypothetical protein [Bacteroidia bacterium]
MKLHLTFPIVCIVISLAYSSCTKDKGPNPITTPAPAIASVSAKVNSAVCFPFDSCVIRFSLDIKGMTPPIQVTWMEPSVLNGTSDLSILLETDQKLMARLQDAQSNSVLLDTVLRKANFDSLVYDYRLPVLGKYKGLSGSSQMYFDGVNWVHIYGPSVPAELEIIKDANFKAIKLKGFGIDLPMWYNFNSSTFIGYHTNGKFSMDSVFISYQPGLGPSWEGFRGKHVD